MAIYLNYIMKVEVIFLLKFHKGVKMENFTYTKARDFEILVHKESGFINYTKLCKDFNKLIETNPGFQSLILSFIQENNMSPTRDTFQTSNFNVKYLVSQNICLMFKIGVKLNEMGTYGPKWMLDYIILHFKPEYYKLIHEALETIDEVAKVKNKSFKDEMELVIRSKEYEIQKLTSTIQEKDDKIEKQTARIDELIKTVNEQSTKIDTLNSKVDEQTTLIKGIRSDVHDLKTDFNDNFTVSNITTATAKYIYLILDNKYYYDKYLAKGKIKSHENVYDTVCCLKSKLNQELKYHGYEDLTEVEKDIKLKYECSCSIDISKFISTHYTDVYCKFYHRKIIFPKGENENILKDISKYINKTLNGKISIVERLDKLDTKMEEYRIELKEISYLAKLITGNKYRYQGRMRTLYETGKGKYFNINRERKYINEDIAKNISK